MEHKKDLHILQANIINNMFDRLGFDPNEKIAILQLVIFFILKESDETAENKIKFLKEVFEGSYELIREHLEVDNAT